MAVNRDPGRVSFDALITRANLTGSSAFVEFPFDVPELYGVKGRVPVRATFDGHPYSGSLVAYGGPHLILVRTDVQRAIGKQAGDTVHVEIELDTSVRVVSLDEDEQAALEAADLLGRFRALAFSHQREYHLWIAEAKRPATRASRIARMVEMVGEGRVLDQSRPEQRGGPGVSG